MKLSQFGILLTLTWLATSASASGFEKLPLPNCFDKFSQGRSLIFSWNPGSSNRMIEAALSPYDCRQHNRKGRPAELNHFVQKVEVVNFVSGEVFGQKLSRTQLDILTQIRYGARFLRQDLKAVDFIRRYQIQDYNFQLNRELTALYGPGFSGEVYQAVVEAKSENIQAQQVFMSFYEQALKDQDAAALHLARRGAGIHVLSSVGLGWGSDPQKFDAKTPPWVSDFAREFTTTGMETTLLQREAVAPIRSNVEQIKPQIRQALLTHPRLFLTGLCKGVTEMLLAWAEVEDEWTRSGGRPANAGRIVGVLNMSGMNHGVYFADELDENFFAPALKWLIENVPLAGRERQGYPKALETMTTAEVKKFSDFYFPRIDHQIPYLNLVGIIKKGGKLEDNNALMNTFFSLNQSLGILPAAHDGFIEYPGNEVPKIYAPHSATLAIESSHMLSDGTAYGAPTTDTKVRRAMYQSLLFTLLEMTK